MDKTINNQDKEEYIYTVSFETAGNNMIMQNVVIASPKELNLPKDKETIINILKKGGVNKVTKIIYIVPKEECTPERLQAEYIYSLVGNGKELDDYIEFAKEKPKLSEELKKIKKRKEN